MLQQLGGPGSSRPGVAAYLLADMHERLTEPCTFIIDDWQYVNAVTEVRGLWNQILRDAPPTCRFVFALASQAAAAVRPLQDPRRLRRAADRCASVHRLAKSTSSSGTSTTTRSIPPSSSSSSGAPKAGRLTSSSSRFRSASASSPDARREFIESITATTDSDLFDFLAEEVLDQQPEETRNFLLTTSILQQITPELAERLAGVHDGSRELSGLEHRGLFTKPTWMSTLSLSQPLSRLPRAPPRGRAFRGRGHRPAHPRRLLLRDDEQWPEAIHHYLRAGLQRQAARLIAKYGEEVVSDGRLGLVDEWLQQLPREMIKQNARLSLLFGEARGIGGDWELALEALQRARRYFNRKGDRRLEALACLKLSTVYSNYGNAEKAAEAAEAGVELVPADAVSTRLRLAGNLAVTRTWLSGSLDDVVRECERVAAEAAALGLSTSRQSVTTTRARCSFVWVRSTKAITNLDKAARFWAETPTNPFAFNEDLTTALVVDGQIDRARAFAADSLRRTAPWPRPRAHALYSLAGILAAEGRIPEAIGVVREATTNRQVLGDVDGILHARLIELLFLDGQDAEYILAARDLLEAGPPVDSRYWAEVIPSLAIAEHVAGDAIGHVRSDCRSARRSSEGRAIHRGDRSGEGWRASTRAPNSPTQA